MNIDTRKIVRVISLIVLIASLCVLAVYIIGDLRDAKTEDDIKGLKGNDVKVPEVLDEYAGLYAENSDTIGWLKIDGMTIDYVVMQAPDEINKYLRHDFYGKDSTRGCLFVDEYCDIFNSDNIIIYGHNMKDGSMFGTLDSYADESFYAEHKIIRFDTIYEKHSYEVVAAISTSIPAKDEDVFRYYEYTSSNDEETFLDYADFIEKNKLYDTGVEINPGDKLLTLSTCAYHTTDGRFVVVARQIS
ncbi:MAG: class B sortase [Firmicutes bacterium]|nr:class B sortase [Bacillota bacterium]